MSEITVEQLQQNIDDVINSLGNDKMYKHLLINCKSVNWEIVEQSENELMKNFEQIFERLHVMREGLQRVFLMNLKALRQFDAKDLCQKVKDKKLEPSVLKSLVQFARVNADGKLVLSADQIREQVSKIAQPWLDSNRTIVDKIQDTNVFLDTKLETMEVFKQKDQLVPLQSLGEQKKENTLKSYQFQLNKLNDIASSLQVMHIPNTKDMISIKTYTQVVEGSVDLAESEFIRITQQNRQDRREILYSDAQKYVQLLMDYVNDIENLLMKAQEEICVKVNISQQVLEQSEMLLMERGLGQHIFMLQASARQKIKDKLPKQKQVPMSSTKDIIKYQIRLLNEKQEFLKNIIEKLPNSYEAGQLVPMVLNLVMGDMIFEEYSYEEEDYIANLENPGLFADPEIMELLKGIENGVVSLLGKTSFAQPPIGGMNPMQLQQMQQMQQMGMQGMPQLPGMMMPH